VADEQASSRFRLPWNRRRVSRARRAESAPVQDWRTTVQSRLMVSAVVLALWTAGIEARLLYLQVIQHSDMVARAARQRQNTL
jgi:hypothetical protein